MDEEQRYTYRPTGGLFKRFLLMYNDVTIIGDYKDEALVKIAVNLLNENNRLAYLRGKLDALSEIGDALSESSPV